MAAMLGNRACFAPTVADEGGVLLGRFSGLRQQQAPARVGRAGWTANGGTRVAGPVCSTSLRPGRYVKEQGGSIIPVSPEDGRLNFLEDEVKVRSFESVPDEGRGGMWVKPSFQRKTKIVCTSGPTSNTKEMIWKLAAEGMNVARLNMSHGDHASHKKMNREKLMKMASAVHTGGKGSVRRKKKAVHRRPPPTIRGCRAL